MKIIIIILLIATNAFALAPGSELIPKTYKLTKSKRMANLHGKLENKITGGFNIYFNFPFMTPKQLENKNKMLEMCLRQMSFYTIDEDNFNDYKIEISYEIIDVLVIDKSRKKIYIHGVIIQEEYSDFMYFILCLARYLILNNMPYSKQLGEALKSYNEEIEDFDFSFLIESMENLYFQKIIKNPYEDEGLNFIDVIESYGRKDFENIINTYNRIEVEA